MKKSFLKFASVALLATTFITSCQDSTKKEAEARENVDEAKTDLDEAKTELANARKTATEQEWQSFKESTNATVEQNEKRIIDLKMQMKRTGKSMDEQYAKKINELEEKNREIKEKVNTYNNEASDDWETFKKEYNRDMDDLGRSLKNFTVDNK
jgi:septation ring formation regulator EzrA